MLSFVPCQVRVPLVFRLAEVRQDVLITPARIAQRPPQVEIALIAANVQHRVEYRRSAEDLASCPATPVILHRLTCRLLWLGSVANRQVASTRLSHHIGLEAEQRLSRNQSITRSISSLGCEKASPIPRSIRRRSSRVIRFLTLVSE
uniref:Uncharacterized protein n=1 Tax=Anopheles culicifacies TaxID=139723 RepID=A0A182MF70_9DIPT